MDPLTFQKIIDEQESFKTKTGKYFQVIKGDKKNPNEKDTFSMVDIASDIEIHEHVGPKGVGFTAYETKVELGKTYHRATGKGEHSHTFGWVEDVPEVK